MTTEISPETMAQNGPGVSKIKVTDEELKDAVVGGHLPRFGSHTIIAKGTIMEPFVKTCQYKGPLCSICNAFNWKTKVGCEISG